MRSGEREREMERDLHTYMGLNSYDMLYTRTHTHYFAVSFLHLSSGPQFLQGISSKARNGFQENVT